jgi:Tryptophan-rich Synechocystis species C-terminal domain/Cadherin-like/Bacterial Ig-like domain
MTYTPSANEVVISGLNISSGGQTWPGVDVVIPLTEPDGSPLAASQFYVKSATDGSLIEVDPTTAAQLYAASIAIKDLNSYYGKLDAESIPSTDWTPVLTGVENVLTEQLKSNLLSSSIPDILGFVATGAVTPGDLEGVAFSLESIASNYGTSYAELALAASVLGNASNLLSSSYDEYISHVSENQPVNFSTLQDVLTNTLTSLNTGTAAVQAISDVGQLGNSLWDDISSFAYNVFVSGLDTILGEISPAAAAREAPVHTAFDIAGDAINLSAFEASLSGLIDAAQATIISSSPFSPAAIASDETILANSIAETQGEVLGSTQAPPPIPQPTASAKSSGQTTVDTPLALSSLFTLGTSDSLTSFTLINTLQGPGELVVNNVVYTGPEVVNVTPAEFQTAYFISSQPGTDEVAVIGFDSAGNSSNEASTLITTSAGSSPPTSTSSDLKVTTASILSSSLISSGGGTIGFTVENLASSAAPDTAISQIYLSTNTTLDSGDILISPGAISDASLAAGASQPEQLPFTLPSNIAGSYYLIVFAGDSAQVSDGGAAGNTYAIPVTIAATSPSPSPPPSSPTPSGPSPITITADSPITTRVGSEPVITSGALRASDTQYPNDADLRYTIVTPPAHGQLIDNFFTTSTFTQADIDNELVDYVQNGSSVSSDSFSFYVSDPSGYRSPVETFTFNILPALSPPPPPPQTPNVTVSLADDTGLPENGAPAFYTSNATLAGTANPGATVQLMDGSTALGSAVADSSGNWLFSQPASFAQGGHNISASVTISGQTATNFLSFDYDTVAPPTPSTPQLALGGNVADTATPTFIGTAEANDEVLLLEGNSIVGSGMVTPNGTWTITTSALGLGYHDISAETVDQAGNIGPVSAADTIEVVPPPPGEVTLNDAAMFAAGDLVKVGLVTAPPGTAYGGTVTEYGGPITADGFTLTNVSRSAYSFITWDSTWAATHDVGGPGEYYDGADTLIVPTDFLTQSPPQLGQLEDAVADTIDLKRADGSAFSLASIDIGPTADLPTIAVFTGTTASGQTISETVELTLPENSPLQPVALTGFNDVTDVKFTERIGSNGDPTSIEFDNIVLGNSIPPSSAPAPAAFTAPVALDDATIVNAGELPLVSTLDNVFNKSAETEYGDVAADGFTITNLDRSDFAFSSFDSNFASVNGYFYDGPDVFMEPLGQATFTPSRIEIQRQDGSAFGIQSIQLDTPFAVSGVTQSATFTGVTATGSTVTQTFVLDNVPGLQTFQFGSQFDDLTSLEFNGNANPLQFDGIDLTPPVVPGPPTTFIALDGTTSLEQVGSNYSLYAAGTTDGPELQYDGSAVTAGEFGSWVPIGAAQTATGYDVAWAIPGGNQFTVWTTDSNGNKTGNIVGVVAGNSYALEAIEPVFNQDLNGDETIGPVTTAIQTDGSTTLSEGFNQYFVNSGSGLIALQYNGSPVTVGEFGSWVPFGAVQTATGYDVAWELPGGNQYTVWSTDANGNKTSNIVGLVAGNDPTLEAIESVFNQDLNGDGTIGPVTTTVIQKDGSTTLSEGANEYFVNSGSGLITLKYNGSPVTVGEFGSWVPFGAVQAAGGGYDVAWKLPGGNQYTVWSTDSSGNKTGNIVGVVAGNDPSLESIEPVFDQDLNSDGTIGVLIQKDGSTTLSQGKNGYYINSGSGLITLQYNGSPVTFGEFGGWVPFGAVQTATGYDVAWKLPGGNQYTVWSTDGSGDKTGNVVGVVAGNDPSLESIEPVFNQDLNGDGVIGIPSTSSSTQTLADATDNIDGASWDQTADWLGSFGSPTSWLDGTSQDGAAAMDPNTNFGSPAAGELGLVSIENPSSVVPPLGDFLQPGGEFGSTPAGSGNVSPTGASGGSSQQSLSTTSTFSDLVPPLSAFLSTPEPMDFSPTPYPEAGASLIMGMNPLQHTA